MSSGISVVIPAYNCEAFLANAIDSILAQSLAPDEIIVVDDGSSDRTAAVASCYEDTVRLISQCNQGEAAARNCGVVAASGALVAFLDADDVAHPHRLEMQRAALEVNPDAVACYTGYWTFDARGRKRTWPGDAGAAIATAIELLCECRVLNGSIMFRRARAEGLSYPVGIRCGPDLVFSALLRTRGTFVVLEQPLYGYRQHPRQVTKRSTEVDNFSQRLDWLRNHWSTYWPEATWDDLERQMWQGMLATMVNMYWTRHMHKFRDVRDYLRRNWPSNYPRPPELDWRCQPRWLLRLKDAVDAARQSHCLLAASGARS